MKKLLFLGIVVLMVESLGAVTLPSTSYSPYAGGTSSTGESFTTDGGTIVTGSYNNLSVGNGISDCQAYQKGSVERSTCCGEVVTQCYEGCKSAADPGSCMDACDDQQMKCIDAPSLPLDGCLSILLILSVAGGMVKLLRNRNKE